MMPLAPERTTTKNNDKKVRPSPKDEAAIQNKNAKHEDLRLYV